MTMRVQIIKHEKSVKSVSQPESVSDIYKIHLVNMQRKGCLLLKHLKTHKVSLTPGENYIVDKVRLVVNPHAEVVLISNSVTVLRQETDES